MSNSSEKKGPMELFNDYIEKKIGINPKYYKKGALFVFFLILILWQIFPVIISWLPNDGKTNSMNVTQMAAAVSTGDNSNVNIAITKNDTGNRVNFQTNKWVDSSGDLAVWRKNKNRIFLPVNIKTGLLKYLIPIETNTGYEIRFKPLGDTAINFVINVPNVYEIVVGDADYQTVTLKRSSKRNSPPDTYVPEEKSNKERTFFDFTVKKNEEIGINVEQKILPNENLWIQIDVLYWGEGNNKKFSQTFKYEFLPAPQIADSLFLQIGLIKNEVTSGNVSAELIYPLISE